MTEIPELYSGTTTSIERLTESPGQMQKHPHTGANYYDGEQIITHLNYALGPDGWDWTTMERGYDELADEVWVNGCLTARFLVHDPNDEGYIWRECIKEETGWQPVNRKKAPLGTIGVKGDPLSLGNDYKAAATDAMKRAARLLGVGLDAWAKDAHPAQQSPQKPPTRPIEPPGRPALTPTPQEQAHADAAVKGDAKLSKFARIELDEAYPDLAAKAIALGHAKANVLARTKPEDLSDADIQTTVKKLREWIAEQEKHQPVAV